MTNILKEKVIVISGAAGGLGTTCAKSLAEMKVNLGLFDIGENVNDLAEEIRKEGGKAVSAVGDICSEKDVRAFIEIVVKAFGRIDGVVNIAAIYKGLKNQDFAEIPKNEWTRVLDVNITGTWVFTKEASYHMRKQKSGSVVNISSATVYFGAPGMLHYVASKAAVLGMTKGMAQEMGPDGIRVNCISPGLLPTEASLERINDEYIEKIKATSALRKLASPQDIVDSIKYLLSDMSQSITGQTVVIDGGRIFL